MTERHPVSVDICVSTFRRPFLAETLDSIGQLAIDGFAVRVIVADNDAIPSARPLVERLAPDFPFPLVYLHAPASNISVARNACLEAARARYVAFVDDDELVSPRWLRELVGTAEASGAAAVLGPVRAIYDETTPDWMRRGDFHSAAPVEVRGAIRTGYTCNALLRWSAPFTGLRFDPALGRSGGEDTDFFYRLNDLGGTIISAPAAVVYEPVPPERARLGWLLRRRHRAGQTHGMRLLGSGAGGVRALALAAGKAGYCLLMLGLTLPSAVGWRRNLLRMVLHLGVLKGLFGGRQAVLYGSPERAGTAEAAPRRLPT